MDTDVNFDTEASLWTLSIRTSAHQALLQARSETNPFPCTTSLTRCLYLPFLSFTLPINCKHPQRLPGIMSNSIPLPLLDRLPTEVLYTIAKVPCPLRSRQELKLKQDLRQHDLNSWCRVCKALHSALNPLVWKTLTIREKDERHLGLDIDPFLRTYTYCPTRDHLQYVKNVIVTTPRYQDMGVTCPHRTNLEIRMLYDVSSGQSFPNMVDKLALNLLPFTRHLRDNQLQSFR